MALIVAEDVWARYGRGGWVLRGATLDLRRGEVLAVAGPNGGGKTTLLKVLAGLLEPAQGRVAVAGVSLWDVGEEERLRARRQVVYVGEKPVMVGGTVRDNIGLGLRLRGVDSGVERTVAEVAERLGIKGLLDWPARGLSAGQAQMVSIARALALEPRALLLDEPFSHLDRSRRLLLSRVIGELRSRGVLVVIAGHEEAHTLRLADRVAWVEAGVVTLHRPGDVLEGA